MKFTVAWKPTAEAQLTELWTTARHRQAIADAANEIETALRTNPTDFGESRDANTRVAVVAPLMVHFEVSEMDRRVTILALHQLP